MGFDDIGGSAQRRVTADYHQGRDDNPVVIVLSAPGRHEAQAVRPAAGQTGRTLDQLLMGLRSQRPEVFVSADRYDYRIANA